MCVIMGTIKLNYWLDRCEKKKLLKFESQARHFSFNIRIWTVRFCIGIYWYALPWEKENCSSLFNSSPFANIATKAHTYTHTHTIAEFLQIIVQRYTKYNFHFSSASSPIFVHIFCSGSLFSIPLGTYRKKRRWRNWFWFEPRLKNMYVILIIVGFTFMNQCQWSVFKTNGICSTGTRVNQFSKKPFLIKESGTGKRKKFPCPKD